MLPRKKVIARGRGKNHRHTVIHSSRLFSTESTERSDSSKEFWHDRSCKNSSTKSPSGPCLSIGGRKRKKYEQGREEEVLIVDNTNHQTVVRLLKTCAQQKDLSKGTIIHADILQTGLLEKNIYVGNALVNLYTKCGEVAKAHEVFDKLRVRDVVSWNVLIAGYAQHGCSEEALNCFERMQHEGFPPDAVTFVCILKACGSMQAAEKGEEFHDQIVKEGLMRKSILVGTALVDMYVKCGALAKAREVFNELQARDVVCWNVLIAGYAEHGHGEEALNCFAQMQREGLSPSAVSLVCILKACGSIGAIDQGGKIHWHIAREGWLEKSILISTALVDMYAKCGALAKAQEVFDELCVRDVVSWTAIIAGYAEHGHAKEALNCFERMQREGLSPDVYTFPYILNACGSIGAADKGTEIHAEIIRKGLLEDHFLLGNALVDMYAKCGALKNAQKVFSELRVRDVISWNALIRGHSEHGQFEKALNCFERMHSEGLSPDEVTFVSTLKACGSLRALDKGKEIHAEIVREGMLEKRIVVGNALVDMYGKCGALGNAQEVFDELRVRDVISWTALIGGYAEHGHGEEALNCFEQMQLSGLAPNAVTLVCILKACGSIGATDKGKEIHVEIVRERWLEKDGLLGNALVNMYAKCGAVDLAHEVFSELPIRDVVSWTGLIAAYGQFGEDDIVLELFNKMLGEGIEPNPVTFTVVLNACSHSGLLEKGLMYFEAMSRHYGVVPTLEHYTCMVDLFARASHFDKAVAVIKKTPASDYPAVWTSLLAACQKWGNVKLGRLAFEHVVRLDEKDAAAYVCMSNIYAAATMLEDAAKIEALRLKNQAGIKPGYCLADTSRNARSIEPWRRHNKLEARSL